MSGRQLASTARQIVPLIHSMDHQLLVRDHRRFATRAAPDPVPDDSEGGVMPDWRQFRADLIARTGACCPYMSLLVQRRMTYPLMQNEAEHMCWLPPEALPSLSSAACVLQSKNHSDIEQDVSLAIWKVFESRVRACGTFGEPLLVHVFTFCSTGFFSCLSRFRLCLQMHLG